MVAMATMCSKKEAVNNGNSLQKHKSGQKRVVVKKSKGIASRQEQGRFFKGETIILGDQVGTRLEIEHAAWKPTF